MKILLLSSDKNEGRTFPLYGGIRRFAGTCEVFYLSREANRDLASFFARHIRLERYDRILLHLDPKEIYKHGRFLRALPFLSLLVYQKHYSFREASLMRKNLHTMPWIQLLSDDEKLIKKYEEEGINTVLIPQAYDGTMYRAQVRPDYAHQCVFYGKDDAFLKMRHQFSDGCFGWQLAVVHHQHPTKHLFLGDIFAYYPHKQFNPQVVLEAMASGALVIMPDPGKVMRVLYGFRHEENCLLMDDVADLPDLLAILSQRAIVVPQMIENSLSLAEDFSYQALGNRIGKILLSSSPRLASDYPLRARIFGVEV